MAFSAGDGVGVEVKGLKEFRAELKAIDKKLPRALAKAAKDAAEVVAAQVRTDARSGTGQQSLLAATARAAGSQTSAKIAVGNSSLPFAIAAFMGSRHRSGWYAEDKYGDSSGRQFPPWVGNQWDPGESWDGHASGEPYVIGGSIRTTKAAFVAKYADAIDDIMHDAFPD